MVPTIGTYVTAVAGGQQIGGADASRSMESPVVSHENEVNTTAPRCPEFRPNLKETDNIQCVYRMTMIFSFKKID
jgi:hypothetical protein